MMGDTIFLTHHKRHLMTLKRQSKTLSVMSATCDHLETQLATPKAHPTQNTMVNQCEAQ